MAPKPIENVDFPTLSDQILELLRKIWGFISNICIVVWSYISGAFLAVWTYPPFEKFRNELVAVLIAVWDYVVAHPITVVAILILVFVVLPMVYKLLRLYLMLYLLRYRMRGMLHDPRAALPDYQSISHDANVLKKSAFAHFQWMGTGSSNGGFHAVGSSGSPSWR